MVENGIVSLKRGHSPPQSPKPSSDVTSPAPMASSLGDSASAQVSLSAPCLAGSLGGKGFKCGELANLKEVSLVPIPESIFLSTSSSSKRLLLEVRGEVVKANAVKDGAVDEGLRGGTVQPDSYGADKESCLPVIFGGQVEPRDVLGDNLGPFPKSRVLLLELVGVRLLFL